MFVIYISVYCLKSCKHAAQLSVNTQYWFTIANTGNPQVNTVAEKTENHRFSAQYLDKEEKKNKRRIRL